MTDWRVGDLALCVRDHDWGVGDDSKHFAGHLYVLLAPRKGSQWAVREVVDFDLSIISEGGETGLAPYLRLRGQPDCWFRAEYFRKIQPPPPKQTEWQESKPLEAAA